VNEARQNTGTNASCCERLDAHLNRMEKIEYGT
jgi:hypothetical protein